MLLWIGCVLLRCTILILYAGREQPGIGSVLVVYCCRYDVLAESNRADVAGEEVGVIAGETVRLQPAKLNEGQG